MVQKGVKSLRDLGMYSKSCVIFCKLFVHKPDMYYICIAKVDFMPESYRIHIDNIDGYINSTDS